MTQVKTLMLIIKIISFLCLNPAVSQYLAINSSKPLKNERISEYSKYFNVKDCGNLTSDSRYVKRHIHHGLLTDQNVPDTHWFEFKSVFNKQYQTLDHELSALRKWRDNLHHVAEHNRRYLNGEQSYALHLNPLGDLVRHTHDEYCIQYLNLTLLSTLHSPDDYVRNLLKLIDTNPPNYRSRATHRNVFYNHISRPVPRKVDWRARGYRPARAQQWRCGACYAFALAHALQGQLYKKYRDTTELSAQQIVDCSGAYGNYGCKGGSLSAALRYVMREGLHSDRDYPYLGKRSHCRTNFQPRVRPRRGGAVRAQDEREVQRALHAVGPLAVAVNAAPRTFQLYRSGIYDDPFCLPWTMNHAMLLVGYTPQYWILLNWWGPHWGEDGYMRIRRGFNHCGVTNMAVYLEL